jgi:hypothetical protein
MAILSTKDDNPVRVTYAYSPLLMRIGCRPESDFTGAIQAGRHEQIFVVMIQLVDGRRAWEIEEQVWCGLWFIRRTTSYHRCRGVLIAEGIGPLPYIAHHIEHTERTRAARECRYVRRRCSIAASIHRRDIR